MPTLKVETTRKQANHSISYDKLHPSVGNCAVEPMERSAKRKMNMLGVFSVCLSLSENCKIYKTNSIHEIMIGIMIGIMIEIMVEFLTSSSSSLCRVCVPNLEAVGAAVPKTPLELNKANSPTMRPWRFAFCGGASGNGGVGAVMVVAAAAAVAVTALLSYI